MENYIYISILIILFLGFIFGSLYMGSISKRHKKKALFLKKLGKYSYPLGYIALTANRKQK